MEHSKAEMRSGLKYVVGKWQADYVVTLFSNDLEHIPAEEFKSDDGRTFRDLTMTFTEDHVVVLHNGANDFRGTWEQTDPYKYRYTFDEFAAIPEGEFKDMAETLEVIDCRLCLSMGVLTIALKKIEDGFVSEEPDIGDMEQSEEDKAMKDIVGMYEVAEAMAFLNGGFELYPRDVVEADVKRRIESGELDEDGAAEELSMFNLRIEFTDDGKVREYSPLPEDVSEEEIAAAIEEGEILCVKDGRFAADEKNWRALNGKYYYDTGMECEIYGEKQSPWAELVKDAKGLIPFAQGMIKIKKVTE